MRKNRLTIAIIIVLCIIFSSICVATSSSSRDYLIGWYKMNDSDTLIPVFKVKGTYYSICRGFEIPLKVCPAGLAWGITPSSMTGTTIGYDQVSKRYYIAIKNSQASNFSDGKYGVGEKHYLTRVKKLKGLLTAKFRPPKNLADFVGWYQPVWFPWVRIELKKVGGKYFSIERELNESGVWEGRNISRELKPLPDRLGFTGFEKGGQYTLSYNKTLHRYELAGENPKSQPGIIRNPLARIPPPSFPEKKPKSIPMLRIGIPSWH